jgi:hypothetical protein
MSRLSFATRNLFAACAAVLLAGIAQAGPVIFETGPYDINATKSVTYRVSGKVELGGVGYIYTYSVENISAENAPVRMFELGIAEDFTHVGLHDEINPLVVSGPGKMLRDRKLHVGTDKNGKHHNYVWTDTIPKPGYGSVGFRVGIELAPGEIQTMSFEDTHAPALASWSLREFAPKRLFYDGSGLGLMPVPHPAPEPATLTLAIVGAAGMGVGAWRRRRPADA